VNPWELRTATDSLRDSWNELHAQVVGKGVTGREGITDQMKNEVAVARTHFRSWYDGLLDRPIEEALGLYNAEFQGQLRAYRAVADKTSKALKKLGEKPTYSTLSELIDRPTGFVPGVVIGVGILFVGWYLLQKQKKKH
jgi:hypothetical protein